MNELREKPIPPGTVRIYADGRAIALNRTLSTRLVARLAVEGLIKRRNFNWLPLNVRKRDSLLEISGPDPEGNAVMLKNHLIKIRDQKLARELANGCRYDCKVISEYVGELGMSILIDLATKKELVAEYKMLSLEG